MNFEGVTIYQMTQIRQNYTLDSRIILSLATPPPIAYKYNKNKNLIFWYKPLELPTDFTLYFPQTFPFLS